MGARQIFNDNAGWNSGTHSNTVAEGGKLQLAVQSVTPAGQQVFKSSGTFTVPAGVTAVQVLVVGGGGGGGGWEGGGGGAGGVVYDAAFSVTPGANIAVTIGNGGVGTIHNNTSGQDSKFGTITAKGGGRGGGYDLITPQSGGSGGGGAGSLTTANRTGAAGTSGQGNAGSSGLSAAPRAGGGGGGAGAAGGSPSSGVGGKGGNGAYYGDIFGTDIGASGYVGGGGGGWGYNTGGAGGTGGGGGGRGGLGTGTAGTANTGGGGGAGQDYNGGNGGSGLVVVKWAAVTIYKTPATWIAPPLSLNAITDAAGSLITRAATLPAGTTAKIYTGINSSSSTQPTYAEQTPGQAVSQIAQGNDYSGKYLWTKIVLSTTDATVTPEVSALSLVVGQHFRRFLNVYSGRITAQAVRNAIMSAVCYAREIVAKTAKTFDLHRSAVNYVRPIKAIAGRLILIVWERVWVPLGVFWSGDWHAPEDAVYARTAGRDRLELLRMTDYTAGQVTKDLTLYDFAEAVLQDAGLSPDEYWIDPELQDFIIPYAWAEPQSHREILRKIAEACLGQVYCDRDGVLRIEGPSFLAAKAESELTIGMDDYFKKDNPVKWSEIANWIEVETQPLLPEDEQEIYRDNEPQEIEAGSSIEITAKYNHSPCINATARLEGPDEQSTPPAGCVIEKITYYAWGADVKVTSPTAGGSFVLVIEGQPLKVMNQQLIVARDEDSIKEHGVVQYTFPANPYVQTAATARLIAQRLLASFKDPRRDLDMTWRGNPALELADRITVPDFKDTGYADFHVTQQELNYAGGLRCTLKGRRATNGQKG